MKKGFGLREDLGLKMEGKCPIERIHPREGQSRWYYIDPRNREEDFTMLTEIKTVDVPTKHTPNPALQEEMFADAEKNPDNYYIWRTVGDDKVREAHAERDGCIFSWDDAPEGGHPGEDYNCRCTAEPFKPERTKSQKYSDAALIARNIKRLTREEGNYPYAYKDTKGIITTANGKNIDSYEKFRSLNWRDTEGNKPSENLIRKNYLSIKTAPTGNYAAKFYEKYTDIKLPPSEIQKITEEHLKNDLDFIRKHVPNFDKYPKQIQDAIIDFQYNTGDIRTFPRFLEAVELKNLNDMIKESHRRDISEDRNNDIIKMLKEITNWNY